MSEPPHGTPTPASWQPNFLEPTFADSRNTSKTHRHSSDEMHHGGPRRNATTFYMYTDRALDHGWFINCPAFHFLRFSSENDNLAEVGMRRALLNSPLRVLSPDAALLFYVPVFEFASYRIGVCANTTHTMRMEAAYQALLSSPYWKRYNGSDHMFASSAWSFGSFSMASFVATPPMS